MEPGKMLAVVGPNGAGKTTLLELICGVRSAQSGRVSVGGRDIRQFDPIDYRPWLGYLPQRIPALPFTLRETLSLRLPTCSDERFCATLVRVAGPQWWRFFGATSAQSALDVRIGTSREDLEATRGRYIARLAAAILGDPPLVLFDDPMGDSDPALDPYLLSLLGELHGKSTVIVATHRPDLIQRADLVAVLNEGALVHFGPVTASVAQDADS